MLPGRANLGTNEWFGTEPGFLESVVAPKRGLLPGSEMKISSTQEFQRGLQERQPERHRFRRGAIMIWSVWVFLAMLMIVACFFNVMWLTCVRAEARRHADSAVIVGGHAYLSDDILRAHQQPFEIAGRAARCRNATVAYLRQAGDSSLIPMINENDVELIQPLAAARTGMNGLTQQTDTVPEQIRVTFGKGQSNDQLRMFFSGLTGVRHARLGVSAAARIEHAPAGFLPGGNATIPVLPFSIVDQSPGDGSLQNAGGQWSQQIESGEGFDNLSWNPVQRIVENGPDGLPEITLTLSPNSVGNNPDSFVPLKFSAAHPTGNSCQTVNWLQLGVTAADLKTLGLNQLSFPCTMSASALSMTECAEIAAWLHSHAGQSFIVCLCHPTVSSAGPENESAAGSVLSTVQLNRAVAARIMASRISAGGNVRICLQPCVLITSTAVMSSSLQPTMNRYVYSVRLCE